MAEHSDVWWEGFRSKKPRDRSPYAVGQPWLAEFPDKVILHKLDDWIAGWDHHFAGKEP